MSGSLPSEFQAIVIDWQSTSDALSKAEGGLAEALRHFRRTGDGRSLTEAMVARQSARANMRHLIHRVWSAPI